MRAVSERWPFSGRQVEVAAVEASLSGDGPGGVVLVGPPGIGKTRIVQQMVDGAADTVDHVYLRGAAAHSAVPYAALNVLLAELDEGIAGSPVLVLGALQRTFGGGDPRRRTLMHIDQVEDVDELSAAVIAQLARVGVVRLVLTCRNLLQAPEAFLELWKDGLLDRLDIEPLTLGATTELLSRALEACISSSAARELWTSSRGNPRYLQAATKADVAAGKLFCHDGVWVAQQAPGLRSAPSVDDRALTELIALPADERAVVEVLAVAGPLPVRILLQAVQADSLDALQIRGMLKPATGDVPALGLSFDVFGDVVHGRFLSTAGLFALETLNRLRDEPGMPARGRTALAAWALGRGFPTTDPDLVSLARLANDHGLDQLAGRFLDALQTGRTTSSALIEGARQEWLDGRTADALATLEPLLTPGPTHEIALPEWVRARLLVSRLLAGVPGREKEMAALLDDVRAQLQRETAAPEDLQGELALAGLEAHAFEGELDRVCEYAPGILATSGQDSRWTIRIRGLLGLAQTGVGAQEQAIRTAENVVARLRDAPAGLIEHEYERATAHLFWALFMAGSWDECFDMLADRRDRSRTPFTGEDDPLDTAEGVVLSYLGRSSEALPKLVPALSQLRVRDRHGLLPLAEAAAAYSHALDGDPDEAVRHLRAIDLNPQRYSWSLREAVLYFRLLTEAWLETPDAAAVHFLQHARQLESTGNRGVELLFLCQAVQLGRYEAADSLAASAAASQGRMAHLAGKLAKGLSSGDPDSLKQAAFEALELGNNNLAGDLASLSIDHLSDADDPMIRVHAEQILRRTSTPARRHVRHKLLSARERAIARKVAQGVPNKEIAQQEHISPRTVEGHVHRIMSKLGLSSRKQLSLIFGREQ